MNHAPARNCKVGSLQHALRTRRPPSTARAGKAGNKKVMGALICMIVLVSTGGEEALAWGLRGHTLVTRLAIRVLEKQASPQLAQVLTQRAALIERLSLVPDVVWKIGPSPLIYVCKQSHYFAIDGLMAAPTLTALPLTLHGAIAQQQVFCQSQPNRSVCRLAGSEPDKRKVIGHAPWRIEQFAKLMAAPLKRLAIAEPARHPPRGGVESAAINARDAIWAAGILSHFISDIANPMHATIDHDGWQAKQGGLHAYFETDLFNSLPDEFENEVYALIISSQPRKHLQAKIPAAMNKDDPLVLALALGVDSLVVASQLLALDRRAALISESYGERVPAIRKPPSQVVGLFKGLLAQRLAVAADCLAYIWEQQWVQAGRPDLRRYGGALQYGPPPIVGPDYLQN